MGHGLAIQIGGTAGEGLETAGDILARALASMGHRPVTGRDFPSRIRGGDTTSTIRIAPGGELAPPKEIDIALVFNKTVLARVQERLAGDAILLRDGEEFEFTKIAKDQGAGRGKNMVALGALAHILAIDLAVIKAQVARRFGDNDKLLEPNFRALVAGFEAAANLPVIGLPECSGRPLMWATGNQAASLGALAAGCRFAAAYPITPASDILEFMTPHILKLGGVAIQLEDEMAALQACIGAAFTGARALTATSGPGLSLMTESFGFAAAAEVPVVVFNCQRPGPSTGMPTKHGQDDLLHMVQGGHGEDVRIVLAPTDVADCYDTAIQAFSLGDKFSAPVIVAMDQQMSLMGQTIDPLPCENVADQVPGVADPDANAWQGTYEPYGATKRVVPGGGGVHYVNSTEHGPNGFTTEDPSVRVAMIERREAIRREIVAVAERPIELTNPKASKFVIAWGSTVGAAREAALRDQSLGVIAIRLLEPFPGDAIAEAIGGAEVVVAEANSRGQLAMLLRQNLAIHDRLTTCLRFDGNPLSSDDILEAL